MDEAIGLTDTTASTNGSIQSTLNEVTIIAVSVTASLSALLGLTLIVSPLIVFGLRRHCKHDKENERFCESQVRMMSVTAHTTVLQTNSDISSTQLDTSSQTPTSVQLEETIMESMEVVSFPRHRQFMPKFGLMVAQYDFTRYNLQRIQEDQDFSYPSENLLPVRNISEGRFGKICLMKANSICGRGDLIPVVVKCCERVDNEKEEFFTEVELLKKFVHQNVISLLGVCEYADVPMMILEYMPYGDLKSFLQEHRPKHRLVEDSQVLTGKSILTEEYFYQLALDVANALNFLATNLYVYGNIAAKNCLVGAGICVKITNFSSSAARVKSQGVSKDKESCSMLQWLSPESLLKGEFTSASDVWSYGVLLWEIVSYGQTPLGGMDINTILKEAAKGALTHSRPDRCPDDIYSVMSSCFKQDALERLSFQDILYAFETKRPTSVKY